VVWSGNPVFLRMLDELLPTTTLLMALCEPRQRPVCVAHRHTDLVTAFAQDGAAAAAEMRRHLDELEASLLPPPPPKARAKRP
jgi:DNA-binding GntR family transcriptional regulator